MSQNNPIEQLETRCAKVGTNISELCREAGIDRNKVQRWKTQLPGAIKELGKLQDLLDRKETEYSVR